MLAIVFGCERFLTYIYGTSFIIVPNHKPLEQIHLKNLGNTPPCLQHMMLRIQPYDVTIKYHKGTEMMLVDALSRLGPQPGPEIKLEKTIHIVNFTSSRLTQIQRLTQEDDALNSLREIMVGWPEEPKLLLNLFARTGHAVMNCPLRMGTSQKGIASSSLRHFHTKR